MLRAEGRLARASSGTDNPDAITGEPVMRSSRRTFLAGAVGIGGLALNHSNARLVAVQSSNVAAHNGPHVRDLDRAATAPVLKRDLLTHCCRIRLCSRCGWGHTSLFKSRCADQAVAGYLLTGITPDPGTVCEQDIVPFTAPSTLSDAQLAARQYMLLINLPAAVQPGRRN
jgi:TAP-like protein